MDVRGHPVLRRLRAQVSLPVLMKETRSRLRGARTQALLFVTTGLAILVGLLIIFNQWAEFGSAYPAMAQAGRNLFYGLSILEGILCALIAPALTAGAISIEREQKTLDLLLLTRLSSANIVLGKLFSSLTLVVTILFCTLPVAAIAFLLGGVDPMQLAWALGLILSSVIFFGSIGLWCSARLPRTSSAVVVTYGLCIVWLLLPALSASLGAVLGSRPGPTDPSHYWWWYYAAIGVASAVGAVFPTTFLSAAVYVLRRLRLRRRPPAAPPWHQIRARRFPLEMLLDVLLWALIAVHLFFLTVGFADKIAAALGDHPEYFLVGNPVVAFFALLAGQDLFSHTAPGIVEKLFVPLTVGILLVGAWVFLVLAVRRLERLRAENAG